MFWVNNRQSAFALQDGQSELQRDNRLESLDQSHAYEMLEEYELTANPGIFSPADFPCICFKVPVIGRITVIKRWDNAYLLVYIPFNYDSWLVSSSSSSSFTRLHGNAWVIGKYGTRAGDEALDWSREDAESIIKNILLSYLLSENPAPLIVNDGSDNNEIISSSNIFEMSRSADRIAYAWGIINRILDSGAIDFSTDDSPNYFDRKNFFLPVGAAKIIPILSFSRTSEAFPTIKMGVADIPFDMANQRFSLHDKWTWFETDAILRKLNFSPTLFSDGPSVIHAWYPLALLNPARIIKVECGDFKLYNPLQNDSSGISRPVPPTVLFMNDYDEIIFHTRNGSTPSWSTRNLDQFLQPFPGQESYNIFSSTSNDFTLSAENGDAYYVEIKEELDSAQHQLLTLQISALMLSQINNFDECDKIIFDNDPITGSIADFVNFKAQNAEGRNVIFHHPNPHPGEVHSLEAINAIIFHETAGYGRNLDEAMTHDWLSGHLGAHFIIESDGLIIQPYGIEKMLQHASSRGYNQYSIGIEFVNLVWTTLATGTIRLPAGRNRQPRDVITIDHLMNPPTHTPAFRGYIVPLWCNWKLYIDFLES